MNKIVFSLTTILFLIFSPVFLTTAISQEIDSSANLFVGGGALPEEMYREFLKVTGPDTKLVVVPTASSRDVDEDKIRQTWKSRGFQDVSILHTTDRSVASSADFIAPLKT